MPKWQDSKIGRNDFQYVACDVGKNVRDRSTDNTETTCGKKITFPVEPKPLLYSSALCARLLLFLSCMCGGIRRHAAVARRRMGVAYGNSKREVF